MPDVKRIIGKIMNRDEAKNLIRETFEVPFDNARFIRDLFNRIEDSPNMVGVPIAQRSPTQKTAIADRVRKILASPTSPAVPSLEREIDQIVYRRYTLTPDEIKIVEDDN